MSDLRLEAGASTPLEVSFHPEMAKQCAVIHEVLDYGLRPQVAFVEAILDEPRDALVEDVDEARGVVLVLLDYPIA